MNHTLGSATQRAYDFIRDRLQNRELQPGTRLVTRSLAKELGTSLNPVREALNRLSSQGLVEHIPGSGTFVLELDAQGIKELYGLREAIESHVVAEATRNISSAELATLNAMCESWRQLAARMRHGSVTRLAPEELDWWDGIEERFHRTLLDAARNRRLSRIVSEQRMVSAMFENGSRMEMPVSVETVEQVFETHSQLVEAIENGNADRARELMASMLRDDRDRVLAHIQNVQH